MGPAGETTEGWQSATRQELEEAMMEMRKIGKHPFTERPKKQREQRFKRLHSRRNKAV